jgi:hypothetical protein
VVGVCRAISAGGTDAGTGGGTGGAGGEDAGGDAGEDAGVDGGPTRGPPQCPVSLVAAGGPSQLIGRINEVDHFFGVWGASSSKIWAVGDYVDGGGAIYFTNNGFTTLNPVSVSGVAPLRSISGRSASDVWAAGTDGGLWHWDGGSWGFVALPAFPHSDWYAVAVNDAGVFVAGDSVVVAVLDGGVLAGPDSYRTLSAQGQQLVAGGYGGALELSPSATPWLTPGLRWFGATQTDPDDIWLVGGELTGTGDGGFLRVVRAADGGLSASAPVICGGLPVLQATYVDAAGTRWAVGGGSSILRSNGDGWDVLNLSVGGVYFYGVWGDGSNVWAVGGIGRVYQVQ